MTNLISRQTLEYRMRPLGGFAFFIIGNSIVLGAYLGGIPFNKFILFLLGITGLSMLWAAAAWFLVPRQIEIEQQAIQQSMTNYWVCWPQFRSDEEWKAFAEQEYIQGQHPSSSTTTALITIFVIFGFLGIFWIDTVGLEWWFVLGSIAALIVAVSYVFLSRRNSQLLNELIYNQRLNAPPPQTYIAQHAIYNEDAGYNRLKGLSGIRFQPESATEWARIEFYITRSSSIYIRSSNRFHYELLLTVLVPPGQEEIARELVRSFPAKSPSIKITW